MESLDSVLYYLAAYWWVGAIVISLALGVRGNIPVWLGIAISIVIFLFFSRYGLPQGVKSAIHTLLQALFDVFR